MVGGFLSGCKIGQLIDLREGGKDICIIGVWPMVQPGNTTFKMTAKQANQFVKNVEAELLARLKRRDWYKRIAPSGKRPPICNTLLWNDKKESESRYRQECIRLWGERSRQKHSGICAKRKTFVGGAVVSSSNSTAKVLIERLDGKKRTTVTAKGRHKKELARNIGREIGKKLK